MNATNLREKGNHAHRDKIGATESNRIRLTVLQNKATKLHTGTTHADRIRSTLRSCVVEFIGTFYLTMAVGMAAGVPDNVYAGAGIGLMLSVMIYMGGHVSGANFNPAVSLGVYLRGRLPLYSFALYVFSQITGAFLAAGFAFAICKDANGISFGYPSVPSRSNGGWAMVFEIIWTFALVSIVLHSATAKAQVGNQFYGIAIGTTVTAAVYSNPMSGCALNPALGLALPAIAGDMSDVYVYILGPLIGAFLAASHFAQTAEDDEFEEPMDRAWALPTLKEMYARVPHLVKCFSMEFVGSMFLCLTVGMSSVSAVGGAIPIGLVLANFVYVGGHISGAHYNFAVTIAVMIRGNHGIETIDFIGYAFAQLFGGLVGAGIAKGAVSQISDVNSAYPEPGNGITDATLFCVEFFGTMALALVVLHVATSKALANNSFFGGAIGLTYSAWAIVGGPYTGGAFNPIVAIATGLVHAEAKKLWIYLLADSLGGVTAGLMFYATSHPSEYAMDSSSMANPLTSETELRDGKITATPSSKMEESVG